MDYGTTNSSIAAAYPNGVELVPLGMESLPGVLRSCVYFDRHRQELAGHEAVTQYAYLATAETRCSDCELVRFSRLGIASSCKWAAAGGGCRDARIVFGTKHFLAQHAFDSTHSWARDFTLDHLVAIVLRRLKAVADARLGADVSRLVLGSPVQFPGERSDGDRQRALGRLAAAARLAGFEEVEVLDEPLAATLASRAPAGVSITVDFGAGTLDVAVLDAESGYVFAKRGLALGGDDLDSLIFDTKLAPRFGLLDEAVPAGVLASLRSLSESYFLLGNPSWWRSLTRAGPATPGWIELDAIIQGGHLAALHQAIEQAKVQLSRDGQARIVLERRGIDVDVPIGLDEFESTIAEPLRMVRSEVMAALRAAGIDSSEVTVVNLTGGSSQIPAFRRLIEDMFGNERIHLAGAFDAVALGLAEKARALWMG